MTFSLITLIASIILMLTFIGISIYKFKLLSSYSVYSPAWDKVVPFKDMHLWSIITFFIALLFMPALIELGNGNILQFLGFFSPIYLMMIALFPLEDMTDNMHESDKKRIERNLKIHIISAILCAVAVLSWVIFVMKMWWMVLIAVVAVLIGGLLTKTLKSSFTFWSEMILFISGYGAALIGLIK